VSERSNRSAIMKENRYASLKAEDNPSIPRGKPMTLSYQPLVKVVKSLPIVNETKIIALNMGCQISAEAWFPVRRMTWNEEGYRTTFVNGVKQVIEQSPIWRRYFSLSKLDRVTITHEPHWDYGCRMPLDRPQEMPRHAAYLGLPPDLEDPIVYVARSGGYRNNDSLDVFPVLEAERDGCYRFFFVLKKIDLKNYPVIKDHIRVGDRLTNREWSMVHEETGTVLGLLPGYVEALLAEGGEKVQMKIEQVNDSFYTNQRLLCSATCRDFVPFSSEMYMPIGNE
jgi:hypothetical protein